MTRFGIRRPGEVVVGGHVTQRQGRPGRGPSPQLEAGAELVLAGVDEDVDDVAEDFEPESLELELVDDPLPDELLEPPSEELPDELLPDPLPDPLSDELELAESFDADDEDFEPLRLSVL